MDQIITRAAAMRGRFASVKARGFRRSLREDGAIDLASIMVGVLVMGILGAVIAAAVFAVIPWSQDNAAKGDLDAVKTAESVVYAQSTGGGPSQYGTSSQLINGWTPYAGTVIGSTIQAKSSLIVFSDGLTFKSISVSSTGAAFTMTSVNPGQIKSYATAALAITAFGLTGTQPTYTGGAWTITGTTYGATPTSTM